MTTQTPPNSAHGTFGFEASSYQSSDDLPPAGSSLFSASHAPPASPTFQDSYTFTTESSPTDLHFSEDTPFHHGQLPRLEIPPTSRLDMTSPSLGVNAYGLASPGYLGHHSVTASPSSGHSNNSPFTPATMHPMSPSVHSARFTPQTPSAISPFMGTASLDAFSGLHHSPVAPFSSVDFYPSIPKSPSNYMMTPNLMMSSYSPSMGSLHHFDEQSQVSGISPMATNSTPPPSVLDLIQGIPAIGVMLPQRTYRPHTQSDRRRYVEEVILEQPIMFYMQNPQGCGISCRDALNSKFMRLVGRDDQMFNNRGPSVSIRLMWPGYAPWSRQIPTRDFRTPPGPITRSKLAKNVAKTVQRFLDVSDVPINNPNIPRR